MAGTTTVFSLAVTDTHGVDVKTLFPALNVVTLTSRGGGGGVFVSYMRAENQYLTNFNGNALGTDDGAPFDVRGTVTSVDFYAIPSVGVKISLAHMSISLADFWAGKDGVPLASFYGFSPDSMLNTTASGSAVVLVERGNRGPDKLWGSGYNDILIGQEGHDRLTGNGGDDTFIFDGSPSKATRDHVTDFSPGHDRLRFDVDWYKALAGVNLQKAFHDITKGGLKHEDKGDRLLYNHKNGHLSYDPDGNEPGKHDHKPIPVAVLDNSPHLSFHDFLVA